MVDCGTCRQRWRGSVGAATVIKHTVDGVQMGEYQTIEFCTVLFPPQLSFKINFLATAIYLTPYVRPAVLPEAQW